MEEGTSAAGAIGGTWEVRGHLRKGLKGKTYAEGMYGQKRGSRIKC